MRIAILAVAQGDELPNGFPLWLARHLKRTGEDCTLIWANLDYRWDASQPLLSGVEVLYLTRSPSSPVPRVPERPLFDLSEVLAPVLRRFDIVYSMASGHPTMHALRQRRFSPAILPYVVTIVSSIPSDAEGTPPHSMADAIADQRFGELYQVRHSDFLVCLDPVQPPQLRALGWKLPVPEHLRVAIRDADMWSTLHREIIAAADAAAASGRPRLPCATTPSVTVCLSIGDDPHKSDATFDSLLRQTTTDFTVNAVTDGSDSKLSPHILEGIRERGWLLHTAAFRCAAEALNIAARDANSDYLLFLYPDDIALPRLVERMLEAASYCGTDALGEWLWQFPSDRKVYDFAGGGRIVCSPTQLYTPTGNDLTGDLLEDSSRGWVSLIRRSVFEAAGGFPTNAAEGSEGSALRTRLMLSGFSTDVVPEFLRYHQRVARDSAPRAPAKVAHPSTSQAAGAAISSSSAMVFRGIEPGDHAQPAGNAVLIAKPAPLSHNVLRPERLRLLLIVGSWPNPPTSGYSQRCLAIIRFLGRRHDLTLVSFLSPFEEPTRDELLPYCRTIYAVRYGGSFAPQSESLPRLVRERQTTRMLETIRSIPTHLYHAAVIEQIFLAPYRELINAPTLLDEHNIESAIMDQASQQSSYAQTTPAFANPKEEAEALRAYEDLTWPRFEVRTAVSAAARREIDERAQRGRTILVENGTDPFLRLLDARPDTGTALFMGALGYYPNVDALLYFIKDIWSEILRRDSSLRLICAGSGATPSVRAIKKERRVELVENPPDIRGIAARASVSIVPLRIGSGTRLKILDSMAMGLPVVSTTRGCEGLSVEEGKHLLIRDNPEDFAEAVVEVLKDEQLWNGLRSNGFELIERHYRWDRVLEPLEGALFNLASARGSGSV
jgi:glycosyltransferase involved in cell wall biosynthesis